MRKFTDCQLKIDACKKLVSDLVLVEALYKGFPAESMQRVLSDAKRLLDYQKLILRNMQREEELKTFSQSGD